MPCDNSHMRPNKSEIASKELAKMVLYCQKRQVVSFDGEDLAFLDVVKASTDYYGNTNLSDGMARLLCKSVKAADPDWIYDGRTRERRDLANWWDEHKSIDAAKDRREREQAQKETLPVYKVMFMQDGSPAHVGIDQSGMVGVQ